MDKTKLVQKKIAENLHAPVESVYIPELGVGRKGKVRQIFSSKTDCGEKIIIMLTSDRVSAFDVVLDKPIPFKGIILNEIAKYFFERCEDIIPNAMLDSPDPRIIVQKQMINIGFECIVRGYLWGSLAADYENGIAEKCGESLPNNSIRYQKLDAPIFTPTTKAKVGHDEDVTFEQMKSGLKTFCEKNIPTVDGEKIATHAKQISLNLFERGQEIASKTGLILVDTKYEFGLDENGTLHLIDEVHTPDSSRYVEFDDWNEKFHRIKKMMQKGNWQNVPELLRDHPELKIKEFSKQIVRDVLLARGYDPNSGKSASLEEKDIIKTLTRYADLYERFLGKDFNFEQFQTESIQEITTRLEERGFIKPYAAVIMAGSDSDEKHIGRIYKELRKWDIPASIRIISAHKQPETLVKEIVFLNKRKNATVIIAVAGGADALSGTASFRSVWPVISCPPDGFQNQSVFQNPKGSSNSVIFSPANVARHTAQIFCHQDPTLKTKLNEANEDKVESLAKADQDALSGSGKFEKYF